MIGELKFPNRAHTVFGQLSGLHYTQILRLYFKRIGRCAQNKNVTTPVAGMLSLELWKVERNCNYGVKTVYHMVPIIMNIVSIQRPSTESTRSNERCPNVNYNLPRVPSNAQIIHYPGVDGLNTLNTLLDLWRLKNLFNM